MYLIRDNLGNECEADDIGGATTAAGQLFEDDPSHCTVVAISKLQTLEEFELELVKITEDIARENALALPGKEDDNGSA